MRLIRHKDAAGRLPDKENRKGSWRAFLVLTALAIVLAAAPRGLLTRTHEEERWYGSGEPTDETEVYAVVGTFAPTALTPTDQLADYIPEGGGMTLWKQDPETGEWVDLGTGEDIVLGNNYKLDVHFEGNLRGGFENPMYWYLGDDVKCQPVTGGTVWDGNTPVGTYDLTEDGHVTVHFNESYLENSNQKLDMSFNLVPTGGDDNTGDDFPWSGHIEGHGIVKNTGELAVQKSAGYYSSSNGTITYTVEASVTEGLVKDGVLTDVMGTGITFDSVDEMTVYDSEGRDVTREYQTYINDLKAQAERQEGNDLKRWTLSPLPPLSKGMRFVVKYKAKVENSYQEDRTYVAQNTVTFDGKKPDGSGADEKSDNAEKKLAEDQITKNGNTTVIEEVNEKGETVEKEVIEWNVRIGSGQWDPLENDQTLTVEDTLGKGLSFRQKEKIKVEWRGEDGSVKGTAEINWTDRTVTVSEGGKKVTYELKRNMFDNYYWEKGDYLMVTYNTDFDRDEQPQNGFENTVRNDLLALDGTTGRLPVGEAVQKTVVDNEKEGYLFYTVIVDIPPASHMKSMQGEGDGHDELDLPYFYIEDRLDFGDDYFAVNVPKDITIHVESKDPGSVWEFENAPYTSGNGNLEDNRETFQILEGPNSSDSVEGKNRRAFRIYFNTARYGLGKEGKLDRHDSIWDIDVATQMTITYKIPYDTAIVGKDGKNVDMTLGELLNQGMKLENRALSRRSGVDLDNRCYFEKTPEDGQIDKVARYLGQGVVEYRVTFENWKVEDTGSRLITKEDKHDGRYCEDVNPTLVDTFDHRMEYVEDSLYVEVRSNKNKLYAIYKYTGTDPVDETNHSLNVNMLDFKKKTYSEEDGNHHYQDSTEIKDTFDSTRKYVFVYQLRLNDTDREDWVPDQDINNTAIFQYDGKPPYEASTSIDIPSDMLQKDFKVTESGTLEYTLEVNPLAVDLVQGSSGESYVNLNSYKLVDEMSDNLELVTKTDGDYQIKVEYHVRDDEWTSLERSGDSEGISAAAHNYFRGTTEEGNLYFILPDNLYIRITYEVIVNGTANDLDLATNKATLYADHKETEEKSKVVEVGDSSARASSDPPVRLEKKDSKTGSLLAGAGFTLYCSEGPASEEEEILGDKQITVTINGEDKTLYAVKTYTTDDIGEIKKIVHPSDSKDSHKYRDALYVLIETKVPDHHRMTEDPYFFYFPDYAGSSDIEKVTYNKKEYNINHTEKNETIGVKNPPVDSFRVIKVDSTYSTEGRLAGAKFELWSTESGSDGKLKKGSILWTGESGEDGEVTWTQALPEGSETEPEVKKDLNLDAGTYYLYETEAPESYVKREAPVTVIVDENGVISRKSSDKDVTVKENEKNDTIVEFYIPNFSTYSLPETGGAGTSFLYLLGSMFILAGGMVLLYNRRLAQGRAGR